MRNAALADIATLVAPEEIAIARSVLYASLFDYPLTLAQLRQTLIESEQTPSQITGVFARSAALHALIEFRDGFFFPRGRYDLVAERRAREARSRTFLQEHRLFLGSVCALPYVRLAALSGSIAHLNLEGDGDLDLFIVTRGRHVWSVAVATVMIAKLMGKRRGVCVNFVIADTQLAVEGQDLFSASQIVHLKPLVGRAAYRRFLAANPFVRDFYPNFHDADASTLGFRPGLFLRAAKRAAEWLLWLPSKPAEVACRLSYRTYLLRQSSRWRSPEQVRMHAECLKLHTQSHRRSVLDRFDRAVRRALDAS
jgi:hypothetical protein